MSSVTIVTPTFSPETFGTPLYTSDLAFGLRDRGWDVQVVTAQPFYPEFKRFAGYGRSTRHDEVEGMPVYRLPTLVPKPGSAASRAVTDLNFAAQGVLRTAARRVPRTDAVFSVSPGTPLTAVVGSLCVKPGGAHVTYVHDVLSGLAGGTGLATGGKVSAAIRTLERHALRCSDRVTTLSPEMGVALHQLGLPPEKVSVSELWATVEAPAEPVEQRATLQYSGSMGFKQGLTTVFDVLEELHRLTPGVSTVVRGKGPQLPAIRQRAHSLPTPAVVEEPVAEAALADALAATPVHLVTQIPGAAESILPSKVINAMAVGGVVFALAPSTSALARLAGECDGVVVADPGDPLATAKALDELLHDGSLASRRQAALDHVARRHDRDTQIAAIELLLLGADTYADPDRLTGGRL